MDPIKEAMALLKANGYRVTPPRAKAQAPTGLNAVGKPYGASYDPKYKMRYKPSTARLFLPYSAEFRQHLKS